MKKRKWWLWGAIIVMIGIIGSGATYAVNLYTAINQAAESSYEPIPDRPKSEKREITVSIQEQDPVSFLLLGVDERPDDSGRSDTIMVATVNPEDGSMILFNIPRDTYVDIIGRGGKDKINHAYAYGGMEMTINTVEHFLDIPIDYYAKINMDGFKDVIDIIGGVKIDVPFTFTSSGTHFPEGPMQMDADTAMKYVQMRKQDPRGDLGRNARQQQVVKAVLRQSLTVQNFNKFDDIIRSVGDNLRTSVAPSDYLALKDLYEKIDLNNIDTFEIDVHEAYINGTFYFTVDETEQNRVSQKLKAHLDLGTQYTKADEDQEAEDPQDDVQP